MVLPRNSRVIHGPAMLIAQREHRRQRDLSHAAQIVEIEGGGLGIKRIHVRYVLRVDSDADREKIDRAFEHHMVRCPVYRSIGPAIDCTTELEIVPV